MKCDDFLPFLETDGMLRRWRARRHAAGCPRCAAVGAAWVEAKRDLTAVAQLSADQRRKWRQAAFETAPTALRGARAPGGTAPRGYPAREWLRGQSFPLPAGIAAAACVLICAVALVVWKLGREQPIAHHGNGRDKIIDPPPAVQMMAELDAASEFASLAMSVQELRAELDLTLVDAQRMEARQQATELLDRYSKW